MRYMICFVNTKYYSREAGGLFRSGRRVNLPDVRGRNSVGRMPASQAGRHGFESRRPLCIGDCRITNCERWPPNEAVAARLVLRRRNGSPTVPNGIDDDGSADPLGVKSWEGANVSPCEHARLRECACIRRVPVARGVVGTTTGQGQLARLAFVVGAAFSLRTFRGASLDNCCLTSALATPRLGRAQRAFARAEVRRAE